jgi:signal peptide peptidase SppA
MTMYDRVLSYFYGQVWAIDRGAFRQIEAILLERASGARLSDDEIRQRIGAGRPAFGLYDIEADSMLWAAADGTPPANAQRQVVSVIGVYGPIVHRAGLMTQSSGLTSAESVQARVRAAAADPGVRAIVLDVDSPGGVVHGLTELAAEVRSARAVKPVAAVANARALSAAYWVLSQATPGAAYATPSALVGSIGVFVEHEDHSEEDARVGVKKTLIKYGENKALGGPHEPLSDEARAEIERQVEAFGRMFEADVAKGRGVSAKMVAKDFGKGSTFTAEDGVERGLVDAVLPLDEVLRKMAGRKGAPAVAAASQDPGAYAVSLARLRGL